MTCPGPARQCRRSKSAGAFLALGGLVALGLLSACGKRGDPLPPLPTTPQVISSLRLAQRGSELEATFEAPRLTTGGARLPVLEVEVLKASGEGAFEKMATGSRRKCAPGERITERIPLPAPGTLVRVAVRSWNGRERSAQGPVVSLKAQPPWPAPESFEASVEKDGVVLRWKPPPQDKLPPPPPPPVAPRSPSGTSPATPSPVAGAPSAPAASPSPAVVAPSPAAVSAPPAVSPAPGAAPPPAAVSPAASAAPPSPAPPAPPSFWVYRRAPKAEYGAPLSKDPVANPPFKDGTAVAGETWCYVARTVGSSRDPVIESASSKEACVSVKDVFPPDPPAGVTALPEAGAVEVSWSAPADSDLDRYRVYRTVGGGPAAVVGELTATERAFSDKDVSPGQSYVYRVTALDRQGNESRPSEPAECRLP